MLDNRVPIHVVTPDARDVVGGIQEDLARTIDVFAWPMKWKPLAVAMAREHGLSGLPVGRWVLERLAYDYRRLTEFL